MKPETAWNEVEIKQGTNRFHTENLMAQYIIDTFTVLLNKLTVSPKLLERT